MKKVAVIGTVGLPASYGGFETLTNHLTNRLRGRYDFLVYCEPPCGERLSFVNGAKLHYLRFRANGVQSIFYDAVSMLHARGSSDVMLIFGVSGCIILPVIKLLYPGKIFVNIDGLEWRRQKWGWVAKRFLKVSEWFAVRFSHAVIADNAAIGKYVRAEYGVDAHMIAYGGDHAKRRDLTAETLARFPFLHDDYFFKVCRIEPENNVHLILEAFKRVKNRNLVVVGNWGRSAYASRLKSEYSECSNIFLLDPIYDQSRLDEIRSTALAYVHGHSAGGTNPSLVEAMSLRLPVLAYDVAYNVETTEGKALYFHDVDSLVQMILSVDAQELNRCSISMLEIARRRYTWARICESYSSMIDG